MHAMSQAIPIIDLFAGPGGLGEGFSAFKRDKGGSPFKIKLSIEKDFFAHQTLLLRSFFRQFPYGEVPAEYYKFISSPGEKKLDDLLELFPEEGSAARAEARLAELGGKNISSGEIDAWIKHSLAGTDRWLLIGGPPCQAYSTVGRSRNKGVKDYDPAHDNRHFLYLEYLRIIANHWPAVFVMENVRGILSSKVKEKLIFPKIIDDLRSPARIFNGDGPERRHTYKIFSLTKKVGALDQAGNPDYEPGDFIIKCEEFGIPQARHRVILIGVRDDLGDLVPEMLHRSDEIVTAIEVLGDLPVLRSGLSRDVDSEEAWQNILVAMQDEQWLSDLAENTETEDIARTIIAHLQDLEIPANGRGSEYIRCRTGCGYKEKWFHDKQLKGVCNMISKAHMTSDLRRYFFSSCFALARCRSPLLSEFPEDLQPNHKNASKSIGTSNFADRFRVQLHDRPATTVMSHISKDGHYYIHYDPLQCRSLTVREAARLQTFPDNYYFMGNRTQQYTQVGNAVPPLLAVQVAEIVHNLLVQAL